MNIQKLLFAILALCVVGGWQHSLAQYEGGLPNLEVPHYLYSPDGSVILRAIGNTTDAGWATEVALLDADLAVLGSITLDEGAYIGRGAWNPTGTAVGLELYNSETGNVLTVLDVTSTGDVSLRGVVETGAALDVVWISEGVVAVQDQASIALLDADSLAITQNIDAEAQLQPGALAWDSNNQRLVTAATTTLLWWQLDEALVATRGPDVVVINDGPAEVWDLDSRGGVLAIGYLGQNAQLWQAVDAGFELIFDVPTDGVNPASVSFGAGLLLVDDSNRRLVVDVASSIAIVDYLSDIPFSYGDIRSDGGQVILDPDTNGQPILLDIDNGSLDNLPQLATADGASVGETSTSGVCGYNAAYIDGNLGRLAAGVPYELAILIEGVPQQTAILIGGDSVVYHSQILPFLVEDGLPDLMPIQVYYAEVDEDTEIAARPADDVRGEDLPTNTEWTIQVRNLETGACQSIRIDNACNDDVATIGLNTSVCLLD